MKQVGFIPLKTIIPSLNKKMLGSAAMENVDVLPSDFILILSQLFYIQSIQIKQMSLPK